MPRQKCNVFKFYKSARLQNQKLIYMCQFCSAKYVKHATRMKKHLLKCLQCPKEVQRILRKEDEYKNIVINIKKQMAKTRSRPAESESSGDRDEILSNSDSIEIVNNTDTGIDMEIPSDSEVPDSETIISSSGNLRSFFDVMTSDEKESLDKSLAMAIYASGTPLNITNHPNWTDFFKKIRPSYVLPSRHQISNPLLDDAYNRVTQNVNQKIREAPTVGIQCDGWSNIRNEGIINVVVTTPKPVLYKTFPTGTDRQTAEYIKEQLKNIFDELGVQKVMGLVTDNAAYMVKARKMLAEETGVIEYGCIAHCLNLLAADIMKIPSLKNIETYSKQIIKEITNSHVILATFNKIQIEKRGSVISLKLPVATRWGSILNCLESLFINKYALKQLMVTEDISNKLSQTVKKNCLDDEIFWIRVEKLIKILQPLVQWIHKLEGDEVNLSEVAEAFQSLKQLFEKEVSELPILRKEEESILTCFQNRKEKICSAVHFAANILDPRYRGEHLDPTEHNQGMEFIHKLAITNPRFEKENKNLIISQLAEYVGKTETFFGESYIWKNVKNISPITWWKGYCSKSYLKYVAVAILTLPPSSAATERSFSKYSFLHSKKRNRLTNDRAGKLTYIACNINLNNEYNNKQPQAQSQDKRQHQEVDLVEASTVSKRIGAGSTRTKNTVTNVYKEPESSDSDSDECDDSLDQISLHDTDSSIGPAETFSDFEKDFEQEQGTSGTDPLMLN